MTYYIDAYTIVDDRCSKSKVEEVEEVVLEHNIALFFALARRHIIFIYRHPVAFDQPNTMRSSLTLLGQYIANVDSSFCVMVVGEGEKTKIKKIIK